MNKIFKRFIAYTIDMMVIMLIVQTLTGIPQINKQLDNYYKYNNEYALEYSNYANIKQDLKKYYDDKKISSEEYKKLINKNKEYKDIINKYYKDNKLSKSNYDKLNKDIDNKFQTVYKVLYYKIEKNSIASFIIYLVAVFAYFVGFNKYTNGQTLGKKLFKLRIVNSKDSNKSVSLLCYIIRTIILYQPIYYLIRLIGVCCMDNNMYLNVTTFVYQIQYYLEIAIVACAMIRLDGRGIHDLLSGTRVALYNKKGEEVEDRLTKMMQEQMNNTKKKVIDEKKD